MAKKAAAEKIDELSVGDKLTNFIQHNKRIFTFSIIAISACLVIFVASYIISTKLHEKSLVEIEKLYSDYSNLKNDGLSSSGNEEVIKSQIQTLSEFGRKNSGYAGARAYAILGELHSERKEWPEAEDAWTHAADKAPKIYLAPVSLFNAALAAEEQGRNESALKLYDRVLNYESSFPGAPRACFSTGRIHEEMKNTDAALRAYQSVVEKWPSSPWAKYSQSRIISINAVKL